MMKDMVSFLLNRGQAIDPTVGSIEAAMDAIDSVLKTATTKRCGVCKVSWTAPVNVCPECGADSRVESLPSEREPKHGWELLHEIPSPAMLRAAEACPWEHAASAKEAFICMLWSAMYGAAPSAVEKPLLREHVLGPRDDKPSATPRTDAAIMFPGGGIAMVRPEFARQLERELAEKKDILCRQDTENDELRKENAGLEAAQSARAVPEELAQVLKACVQAMTNEVRERDGTWIGRGPGSKFRDAKLALLSYVPNGKKS